jgi:glycine/sarcosine N-methyltransferase
VEAHKGVTEFYDALASDYDAMTGFEKRFVAERPFFRMIVERYGITTAVDAGCGTGFHSFLLTQLGVSVTAVDVSKEMLRHVSTNARRLALHVDEIEGRFETLSHSLNKQYDAVFCLGNSLVHMQSEDLLLAAISNFASLLKSEGALFIQILNYDRILAMRERVQSVKEVGNTTFVRFYDFERDVLRFNIMKLEKKNDSIVHELNSVDLRPLRKEELNSVLHQSGLGNVAWFGGISLERFVPESSKDLFAVAKRV